MAVPTETITRNRLEKWAVRLQEMHATPVVLIGIGHDEAAVTTVICTLDEPEMSIPMLRAFLLRALIDMR
jgi:hypothetical protein